MIIDFNRDNVKDTGSDIQVVATGMAYNGAHPSKVAFMISYEDLDNYVGDYRGYWTREAFARSDDYFPLITNACAYAALRFPEVLSQTEINYIWLFDDDFPQDKVNPKENVKKTPLELVMNDKPEPATLNEASLTDLLIDVKRAKAQKEVIFEVISEKWGLEFKEDSNEKIMMSYALANDIYSALKESGHL